MFYSSDIDTGAVTHDSNAHFALIARQSRIMSEDEPMEDTTESSYEQQLPLSADERQVLELYDKLQQIQLEIAILKAQTSYESSMDPSLLGPLGIPLRNLTSMLMKCTDPSHEDSPAALALAQEALLLAKSKYKLRSDAVELIVIANPILKAVHSGTNASPIERCAVFAISLCLLVCGIIEKLT